MVKFKFHNLDPGQGELAKEAGLPEGVKIAGGIMLSRIDVCRLLTDQNLTIDLGDILGVDGGATTVLLTLGGLSDDETRARLAESGAIPPGQIADSDAVAS